MGMINANSAQQQLGCDEATLSNYINNGTLRSQRVDGQLMVEEDDVRALMTGGAASESSDSILVLDGESEDLSIDLGEVVDDGAATLVDQQAAGASTPGTRHGTDQITFGDELEVVSFDDQEGNTEELAFGDDTEATVSFDDNANTENLSFTESNTAVLTDVDETAAQTSDYQTVEDADFADDDDDGPNVAGASVRRSVRSERMRPPPVKVSPFWIVLLVLTLIVSAAVIAPFYPISHWPKEGRVYYNGDRAYGIDDTGYASLASSLVGFDVEPDQATWEALHDNAPDQPHRPLNVAFPEQPNRWRYREYLGDFIDQRDENPDIGSARFMVTSVEETEVAGDNGEVKFEPTRAIVNDPRDGTTQLATYPVQKQSKALGADQEIIVYEPVLDY